MVVATGSLLLGLTPMGAADPAFPDDGRVISANALTDVAFDHSGRVVVVGYTPEDSRRALVAWYASVDGTLGLVHEFTSFAAWQPRSVAVAADDRIVVGGLSGGFDHHRPCPRRGGPLHS